MKKGDYKKISIDELTALISSMEPEEGLDFFAELNEEGVSGAYGARCLDIVETTMIIIAYYGGGYTTVIDVSDNTDSIYCELCGYLSAVGLEGGVYVSDRTAKMLISKGNTRYEECTDR